MALPPKAPRFLDKDEEMKKLLLGVIFIAANASAQAYVSGNYYTSSVTPTVTAAATNYTIGDSIGGVLTFTGMPDEGIINNIIVVDQGAEAKAMEICFYSATVTATDNAAFDPTDAQLLTSLGCVGVSTFSTFSDNGIGQSLGAGITYHLTPGASTVYGVLIDKAGGYLFDATDAVTVALKVLR